MKLRYEPSTKTIRTVPENYMAVNLADMDAAVDRKEMGLLIEAAPDLLAALKALLPYAESRAEDMAIEAFNFQEAADEKMVESCDQWEKANAAVDAARLLLQKIEGEDQ